MKPNQQATLVTVFSPSLRSQLATVVGQRVGVLHAKSVSEAMALLAHESVRMILLEPDAITDADLRHLRLLTKRRIGVTAVAVLSGNEVKNGGRLLDLGACGVRDFVDLRPAGGWHKLRDFLNQPAGRVQSLICHRLSSELTGASFGVRRFFDTLVRAAPIVTTSRRLAGELKVDPSTLVSRFHRARLPSPKQYLALTRLVYARALFETVDSIGWVAVELNYSSPQSFGRHVRMTLGMTAGQFKTQCSTGMILEHAIGQLVLPYRAVYSWFDPIGEGNPQLHMCPIARAAERPAGSDYAGRN